MKRLAVAAAVAAAVVGLAMAAGAATDVTNWSTGTYQLVGGALTGSGLDSAIIHVQSPPTVTITKWAYNVRTNDTQAYSVNAVSGDVIQFTINWAVTGEATADTIVIRDYVPALMTVVAASNSSTQANLTGAGTGASSIVGTLVSWTNTGATDCPGTDPGPAANGVLKFRATAD